MFFPISNISLQIIKQTINKTKLKYYVFGLDFIIVIVTIICVVGILSLVTGMLNRFGMDSVGICCRNFT